MKNSSKNFSILLGVIKKKIASLVRRRNMEWVIFTTAMIFR